MHDLSKISKNALIDQEAYIKTIIPDLKFDENTIESIKHLGKDLVGKIANDSSFTIEKFLQEYSLSEEEGIAIMCLAESLVRVPDYKVAFDLASDKLQNKDWSRNAQSNLLIQAASLGLNISSKFVKQSDNILKKLFNKAGAPLFVTIMKKAISFFSKEFILSTEIKSALEKGKKYKQYRFSFDLLGESSRSFTQAEIYFKRYMEVADILGSFYPIDPKAKIFHMPNLSVKFTSLYPRIELDKYEDIKEYLLPKLITFIKKLKQYQISISFDAEEADRLEIYMLLMQDLIEDDNFSDYEGIGFVVQAYQKRAKYVLEEILNLSKKTGKKIPIRLVKGAYWDSEIKYAQENGLKDYPVFTKKDYSDANYIACARMMIENHNHIFCQFGTHNALTAAYIIEMAKNIDFEFQKLYGMGNVLHQELADKNHQVRIYAPIGETNDLLAYLMRRMLENGANSSFIHKVHDETVDIESLTYDLREKLLSNINPSPIILPEDIYKDRKNSKGLDRGYSLHNTDLRRELKHIEDRVYKGYSIINGEQIIYEEKDIYRPGNLEEKIGTISHAQIEDLEKSLKIAEDNFRKWRDVPLAEKQKILNQIAFSLEENQSDLINLLMKEAGKSVDDAIAEIREAVDFCRYYAIQAKKVMKDITLPSYTGERNILSHHGRGIFVCISPWNFPLAIFLGQIVAALVTGNSVIAKPAEQTSLIATFTINLIHKAGIPVEVLQLVVARGSLVGQHIISSEKIAGVTFTGSTETARKINMSLAERKTSIIPFIAETGGQNAMIVDSTALLEQVCDDVLHSSFYSAGQRCSALRILYIQDDIYDELLHMISDSIATLRIGDTLDFANDIGPVIDASAKEVLVEHIEYMKKKNFNILGTKPQITSHNGHYIEPHIIEVDNISDIPDENFGPILHVAKYKSKDIDQVIDDINNYGYGLTFGIHSRIESKIEYIRSKIEAGNIYANRSTTGAVVGTHPFGGEKKSGTGFKAGGPHYLLKFLTERTTSVNLTAIGGNIELLKLAE